MSQIFSCSYFIRLGAASYNSTSSPRPRRSATRCSSFITTKAQLSSFDKKPSMYHRAAWSAHAISRSPTKTKKRQKKLERGPMPNLMAALPNIGGALCSTPQSLA